MKKSKYHDSVRALWLWHTNQTPYFDSTVRWDAKGFSVYNYMYIPRDFGDPEQNFWNLVNDAILCDVAVDWLVEITGSDADKFTSP
ncbi:MAG: hypothetical protein ACI9YO_003089 [Gammaproteobacteria bacterium]|jgi:aminomethyltransferase